MNEIENKNKKLENNFKIILILSSIIILSAPSNIYIILPILLYLISLYFNRSKTIPLKSICIYFFLPCLILFILQIVTNGIYVLRDDFLIDMELFSSPDKNLKIAKIFL